MGSESSGSVILEREGPKGEVLGRKGSLCYLNFVGALRCKVSPRCKKLRPLILASFLLSSALPALPQESAAQSSLLNNSPTSTLLHSSAARYWQGLAGGWPGLQRGRWLGSAGHLGSPS